MKLFFKKHRVFVIFLIDLYHLLSTQVFIWYNSLWYNKDIFILSMILLLIGEIIVGITLWIMDG